MSIKQALEDYEQLLGMMDGSERKEGLRLLKAAREELGGLQRESRELGYLEEYGVDNWQGYESRGGR